jgi:hypothetical protein
MTTHNQFVRIMYLFYFIPFSNDIHNCNSTALFILSILVLSSPKEPFSFLCPAQSAEDDSSAATGDSVGDDSPATGHSSMDLGLGAGLVDSERSPKKVS